MARKVFLSIGSKQPELTKSVEFSVMFNVEVPGRGKVHELRFPWMTKCGTRVDKDSHDETNHPATCKICMNSGYGFAFMENGVWVFIQRGYFTVDGKNEYYMSLFPTTRPAEKMSGAKLLPSDESALDTALLTITGSEWAVFYADLKEAEIRRNEIIIAGMNGNFFPLT